jgi:hypothetical protein
VRAPVCRKSAMLTQTGSGLRYTQGRSLRIVIELEEPAPLLPVAGHGMPPIDAMTCATSARTCLSRSIHVLPLTATAASLDLRKRLQDREWQRTRHQFDYNRPNAASVPASPISTTSTRATTAATFIQRAGLRHQTTTTAENSPVCTMTSGSPIKWIPNGSVVKNRDPPRCDPRTATAPGRT